MLNTALQLIAIVAYLSAAGLILRQSRDSSAPQPETNAGGNAALWIAAIGVIAHGLLAANITLIQGHVNYSVTAMATVVSALLVALFLLFCTTMPIKRLGIIVYPAAALCLIFAQLWNSEAVYATTRGPAFAAHVLIAMLAYAILAIATFQALLYVYQERQIKQKNSNSLLATLPPLQTMETLLFRLLAIGVLLLTFTLLSGALFSQQLFGVPFTFEHHTILAVLGWLAFAAALYKRARQGMRGSQAVIWIVSGFILIQLGYFGTKIVVESLALQ